MNKWEDVAFQAWQAILSKINAMREEGYTLQQIADAAGVKNRALIGEWLNGNRKAVNAPFSSLMGYLEGLGIDYRSLFPTPDNDRNGEDQSTIDSLRKENERLRAALESQKNTAKILERILTAGLRGEALPEDEKKDDDK